MYKTSVSTRVFPIGGMGGGGGRASPPSPPPAENLLILPTQKNLLSRLTLFQIFIPHPKVDFPPTKKQFSYYNPIKLQSLLLYHFYLHLMLFVMLILILINVQYLQNVVFSFKKGPNDQNHSSSGSHHPIKKSPLAEFSTSLTGGNFPPYPNAVWKTLLTACKASNQ